MGGTGDAALAVRVAACANLTVDPVVEAASELGVSLEHLGAAGARSRRMLEALTAASEISGTCAADVIVCGSIGRGEMTRLSDIDAVVIDYAGGCTSLSCEARGVRDRLAHLCDAFAGHQPRLFGRIVSAKRLTEPPLPYRGAYEDYLGLLIIQEGASAGSPEAYKELVARLVAGYVSIPNDSAVRVHRIRNGLTRLWRQTASDVTRRWQERHYDPGWLLQYAKLGVSRRVSYIGGLLPTLSDAPLTSLIEPYTELTPLGRIAALVPYALQDHDERAKSSIRAILEITDKFVGLSGSVEWRERAATAEREDAKCRSAETSEFLRELRVMHRCVDRAATDLLSWTATRSYRFNARRAI